jgi:hypothetical protein
MPEDGRRSILERFSTLFLPKESGAPLAGPVRVLPFAHSFALSLTLAHVR